MKTTDVNGNLPGGFRRQVLSVSVLCAVILVVAVTAHLLRQRNSTGRGPVAAAENAGSLGASQPATSAIETTCDSDEFWKKLTGNVVCEDPVLFGLKTTVPIKVDGEWNDNEWSHRFQVLPFDPTVRDSAALPEVRCLWNSDTLFIAARIAESSQKLGNTGYCQVVLATSDPAVRFRFAIDTKGMRVGHRLTIEQSKEIPSDGWQAALVSTHSSISAEIAVSKRSLGIDSLDSVKSIPLIVRMGRGPAEKLDSPITSAYWLLDSLRGFRTQLLLLDTQSAQPRQATRFCNGAVEPGVHALQWDLRRFDIKTGVGLEIPVDLYINEAVETGRESAGILQAQLVPAEGSMRPLSIACVPAQQSGPRGMQHMRVVVPPQEKPGLYEVRLLKRNRDGVREVASWPIWVAKEWTESARQYLLGRRDVIESATNDSWGNSITVAHATKALEQLDPGFGLDLAFLRTVAGLREAIESARAGKPPLIPTGTSRLSLGATDGTTDALTLQVPFHYDRSIAWPVCWSERCLPNMINIKASNACTAWAVDSPSLHDAIRIDPDRRYAMAYCNKAYELTDVLIRHPEPWAAVSLNARIRWSLLTPNANNVPLILYCHQVSKENTSNTRDDVDLLVSQTGARWMQDHGCRVERIDLPYTSHHDIQGERLPEIARWLLRHQRQQAPRSVQCTADGYECTEKYWVRIDAIAEQRRLASLSATLEAGSVVVKTNGNVLGYTLNLDRAPVPPGTRTLSIIEDGQPVGLIPARSNQHFFNHKLAENLGSPSMRKSSGKGGPISNVLANGRLGVVFGVSGTDPKRTDLLRKLADRLTAHAPFRCAAPPVLDVNCDEQCMQSKDVILIGSPKDNAWLRRIAMTTPFQLADDSITVGERRFTGSSLGAIGIYPNPLNPKHSMLIVGSANNEVLEQSVAMLTTVKPEVFDSDYVIFEPASDGKGLTILWADQFDGLWNPISGHRPIATLRRSHPDWQWTQLLGEHVRQRAGADAFFAHRVLRCSPARLAGPISAHDLYQCFHNDWIVMADISATVLRNKLLQAISGLPEAVTCGLLNPQSGAFQLAADRKGHASGSAGPLVRLATLVSCEKIIDEQEENEPNKPRKDQPICLHLFAQACELTSLCTAECLVDFLREHPQVDLDDLLDRQTKPASRDKIKNYSALGENIGL